MNRQFVLTEGIPGIYGPRIYIENNPDAKAIHAVLARESIWGGYDKSYVHHETGTEWVGYEFSYPEGKEEDRLGRALAALEFDKFTKADATSIMLHFIEPR